MKQRNDKSVSGLVIIGLPLLLAAGCAANKADLARVDPQTPQIEDQVKTLLDQAAVPAVEPTSSPNDQAAPQLTSNEAAAANATTAPRTIEATAMPEATATASPAPATSASPEAEATASSEPATATQPAETVIAANSELSPDAGQAPAKTMASPPQQMILYFGFNQDEISPADQAVVKQHAEYLLAHPEYTLLITGHTDNRGPKAYNRRLSKARAGKVAQLLEADGVPKSQLRVSAMGDAAPLVDPDDYRHNRRVEFIYQDAVMAKSP
jgi:peptidoglycan-associated lipoprotein